MPELGRAHVCMCVCVCIHVRLYMYMYLYAYVVRYICTCVREFLSIRVGMFVCCFEAMRVFFN